MVNACATATSCHPQLEKQKMLISLIEVDVRRHSFYGYHAEPFKLPPSQHTLSSPIIHIISIGIIDIDRVPQDRSPSPFISYPRWRRLLMPSKHFFSSAKVLPTPSSIISLRASTDPAYRFRTRWTPPSLILLKVTPRVQSRIGGHSLNLV